MCRETIRPWLSTETSLIDEVVMYTLAAFGIYSQVRPVSMTSPYPSGRGHPMPMSTLTGLQRLVETTERPSP